MILDLHWTHDGTTLAVGQQPMPNRDHSIEFWQSCATYFKDFPMVIFDIFNEPYPNFQTVWYDDSWQCWKDGGSCPGIGYQAAGMQDLIFAVRATGA